MPSQKTLLTCLIVLVLAAGCTATGGTERASAGTAQSAAMRVVTELTCFMVAGPRADPAPLPLEGEVWHDGTLEDAKAALVLVTTGVGERHYWDGDTPGLGRADGTTLPRVLAAAGYAVFPYDRLGQGGSPYRGHDALVTGDVNIQQASEVVAHVRAGTYALGTGSCDATSGPAIERVHLGGHSYGGLIATGVAVQKGGLDGVLVMETSHYPSAKFLEVLARCTPRSIASDPTSESATIFCPGPNGYSEDCINITTYLPGTTRALAEAFCGNDEIHPEPRGAAVDFPATIALGRPGDLGGTPLHFVFGQYDCAVNEGADCTDTASRDREVEEWKAACGCDVTATEIPDIGHDYIHHFNQWMVGEDVLAWLDASLGDDRDPGQNR